MKIIFLTTCMLLGFFSQILHAQFPGIDTWLKNATQIGPAKWMSNYEVTIKEFEIFQSFILKDSGDAMWGTTKPISEFKEIGAKEYGCLDDRWCMGKDFMPTEVNHPIAGISWEQAERYCDWLSFRVNSLQYTIAFFNTPSAKGKFPDLEEVYSRFKFVRFRLPNPEEWTQASSMFIHDPKIDEEVPSRYLHTRFAKPRKKVKTMLHMDDNVSELTASPGVVAGGNFADGSSLKLQNNMLKPDIKTGFRVLIEFVDSIPPHTMHRKSNIDEFYDQMNTPQDYLRLSKITGPRIKNNYYPYKLKKNCVKVSGDIWISKSPITNGEYGFHLYRCLHDSGAVNTSPRIPALLRQADGSFPDYAAMRQFFLTNENSPIAGITKVQAEAFCQWMTIFNMIEINYPGSPTKYLFRLPTKEEEALAQSLHRMDDKKLPNGFRYVVEILPPHPDALKFKTCTGCRRYIEIQNGIPEWD